MKITKTIRPLGCANGACPGIHVTTSGAVLVQGAKLAKPRGIELPSHEGLVSIPRQVFEDLIRQYRS